MVKVNNQKKNLILYYMKLYNKNTRIYFKGKLSKTFKTRFIKSMKNNLNVPQQAFKILKKNKLIYDNVLKTLVNRKNRFKTININQLTEGDKYILDTENLIYKADTKRFVLKRRLNYYNKKGYTLSNYVLQKFEILKHPIKFHKNQIVNGFSAHEMPSLYLDTIIKKWFKQNFDIIKNWSTIQLRLFKYIVDTELYDVEMKEINVSNTFKNFWNSIRKFFFYTSPDGMKLINDGGVDVIVSQILPFENNYIQQNYLDSVNHCFFHPIKDWAENKKENVKSKSTKKVYNSIINKCENYIKKYSNGIPENKIQDVCDDLRIDVSVHSTISYFNQEKCQILKVKTNKKKYGMKHFKYVNTRNNHVDILSCINNEVVEVENNDDMLKIMEDIRRDGRIIPYSRYKNDYLWINDINTRYVLKSPYMEAVKEFEEKNNLQYHKLIDGEKISDYVQNSVRIPVGCDINNPFISDDEDMCPLDVDFNEEKFDELMKDENFLNIKMWDMKKAFYNFEKCPFYDGFGLKPYAILYCDIPIEDAINHECGFYKIENLDYSNVDENKRNILELSETFKDGDILTHVEIKFLHHYKAKFKIISGCYAIKGHLHWTEKMTEKVDGVSNYSRWVGSQIQCKDFTSHDFDNTDPNVISNIMNQIEKIGCDAEAFENKYEKKITIKYRKQKIYHRAHISSYIYAYCRLSMLCQAFEFDSDDIIRFNVDAIYFNNCQKYINTKKISSFIHDPKRDGIKSKKYINHNGNTTYSFTCYKWFNELDNRQDKYFQNIRIKLISGAGGTGKTTEIMLNKSIIDPCYLAHSYKLCRAIQTEYETKLLYSAPYQHLLIKNPRLEQMILNCGGLYVIDEVSSISYNDIKRLFFLSNKYSIPMIFCGDIGFQTSPVLCDYTAEQRKSLFKHIETRTFNYRFRHDKFHNDTMTDVRNMMTNNKTSEEIMKFVIDEKKYDTISKDDMLKNIKLTDILLSSRHKINDEYNSTLSKKFIDTKKYIVKHNSKIYCNGDIVINKVKPVGAIENYSYTIHSFQGETIKNINDVLYIDTRELKDRKVLYTAMSRAMYKRQIKFII